MIKKSNEKINQAWYATQACYTRKEALGKGFVRSHIIAYLMLVI